MTITSTSGVLACVECGYRVPMRSPEHYNRVGWPKHCGKTMEWRASSTAAYVKAMRHASGSGGLVTTTGNTADALEEMVERAAEQGEGA